jgi:hypothetical protein
MVGSLGTFVYLVTYLVILEEGLAGDGLPGGGLPGDGFPGR